jgi:hypothetical protein
MSINTTISSSFIERMKILPKQRLEEDKALLKEIQNSGETNASKVDM